MKKMKSSHRFMVRYKNGSHIRVMHFKRYRQLLRFVRRRKLSKTKFYILHNGQYHRFVKIGNLYVTKQIYVSAGAALMSDNYDYNTF